MKAKKSTKKKTASKSNAKKKNAATASKSGKSPSIEQRGYTIIAKPSKPSFTKAAIEKMMAASKEL